MTVLLRDYFAKIKIDLDAFETLLQQDRVEALNRLYHAHVRTFPYNNLALRKASSEHPAKRTSLTFFDHDRVMSKGGYCFQITALLHSVLTLLGFSSEFCQSRGLLGAAVNAPEVLSLPITHVILLVSIGGQCFLLEPSMGMHAPRFPLLINGGEETIIQDNHEFRFRAHEMDVLELRETVYALEKKVNNNWVTLMQTDLLPVDPERLKHNLLKLECFPQTIPIRDEKIVVGVVTDTGGKSLVWDVQTGSKLRFRRQDGEEYTQLLIDDFDEAEQILKNEFNIDSISAEDIKSSCSTLRPNTPKRRWSLALPIQENDLERMGQNLA